MFSVADFIEKYDAYSAEELKDIHDNQDGYNADSLEALYAVINKRGGLPAIIKEIKEKQK